MKAAKKEENVIGRWLRFQNAYGKHLATIDYILIVFTTIVFIGGIRLKILYIQLPYSIVDGYDFISFLPYLGEAIIILHALVVKSIATKELYPYKILRRQSLLAFLLLITYAIIASYLASTFILAHFFPDLMIDVRLLLLLNWFFSINTALFAILFFASFSSSLFISHHTKSRLCFRVVLDCLNRLPNMEKRKRMEFVSKYFKFFRKGLHSYNKHIMKKMPEHPKVKNIDFYFDRAYLSALEGSPEELNNLAKYVEEAYDSLGERARDHDFLRFLMSLQHIRGEKGAKNKSIYVLSDLITTIPLSRRIMSTLKIVGALVVALLTIIAAIIRIMMFFI